MRTYRREFVTVRVLCFIVNLPLCHALCKAGEFLSSRGRCEPCPCSSFMTETSHNHSSCLQCTENAPTSAELWHPCNATHNTIYRCVNDTFNANSHEIMCQKCRPCPYPGGKPCNHDQDTVCCLNDRLAVVSVESNENCIHKSTHDKYCCIESGQTKLKGNMLYDVTQTEISEMQEQRDSSENKSMPNINININRDLLSTRDIARIIVGSIAGFIAVNAIIIGVIYLLWNRTRTPPNYQIPTEARTKKDEKAF